MSTGSFDPLWVPLITHYTAVGQLDAARTRAHLNHLAPYVRQYLIAGTTEDGWTMPEGVLDAWLNLVAGLGPARTFLVGAFASDTAAVIARARHIEARLATSTARFAGLTVCAPVDAEATQDDIVVHVRAVLAATRAPVAIYQLPQVTGCLIAPETIQLLAADPRVTMVKDTSGSDAIALAGRDLPGVRLVRGAEGAFAKHLRPYGRYDGWLVSSANGLAAELRSIADAVADGCDAAARSASDWLSRIIDEVFAAAAELRGNTFADANRAVDHVVAHGPRFLAAPAIRADGSHLPAPFLARVRDGLDAAGLADGAGYLGDRAASDTMADHGADR